MLMNSCTDGDAKLACMYTYRRIGVGMTGYAPAVGDVYLATTFGVNMRTTPTITQLKNFTVAHGSGTKTSSGGSLSGTYHEQGVQLYLFGGMSGMTVNGPVILLTDDVFALDAELL